jgi:hypothetical protein
MICRAASLPHPADAKPLQPPATFSGVILDFHLAPANATDLQVVE